MRSWNENLILDMDTLCHGHPIFELASMFNAYCGFGELDHSITKQFLGIEYETAAALWRRSLELYLGTTDEARIRDVADKAKIIGYLRLLRRRIRRNGFDTETGRAEIECCRAHLADLLSRTKELVF